MTNHIVKDYSIFLKSSTSARTKVGAWQVGDLEGPSISCFSGSTSASPVLAGVSHRYQESFASLAQ